MAEKVVLAYSGGLDTSVAIKWLAEEFGFEVIAFTIDVGNERDFTAVKEKALGVGASKALVEDAKELFIKYFAFPALQANALYQGQYPLATALSRPLMAKLLVDVARAEGASAVAHGCTGKGNDQVRFDVGVTSLAPELRIIAPARQWGMTREETMVYAQKHGIPVSTTTQNPYSVDENLWGRSIECGILEDPWTEPPEEVFSWTASSQGAPGQPGYTEIGFEMGVPTSLDGQEMDGVSLVKKLNEVAGQHGVGRIDHIEDRLVGIKSREIYEAPAAVVLIAAHRALEAMTLSRGQLRFKESVAWEYADLIYDGLWFTSQHQDLAAYVQSSQRHVTGTVKVKLLHGTCRVVGRKSPRSLYSFELATYDKGDTFDQTASEGFIHIWGLPVRVQARTQLLSQPGDILGIAVPPEEEGGKAP